MGKAKNPKNPKNHRFSPPPGREGENGDGGYSILCCP